MQRSTVTDVASAAQESQGEARPLGNGWLAAVQRQAQDAAEVRGFVSGGKLGEIMVRLGFLSHEARDRVLERQPELGLPFGECCVRLGLIDRDALAQALSWQFGYPCPAVAGKAQFGKELAILSRPFAPYAEALRALTRRLRKEGWLERGKALAIMSAAKGEGKSHLAANLAVCLGQAGSRTLLVDADLRQPTLHVTFGVPQHPGLSRSLCGFAPSEVVRRFADLTNLTLVTAGPLPPNPSELLSRSELALFMRQASEHYDAVIVDTPAAGKQPDAHLIAEACGSALIVARRNSARQRAVLDLKKSLDTNGVGVAGVLMNAG